jgi:hypothetical protein
MIVEANGHVHEFTHGPGRIASFERDIIHDVRNDGRDGAVTLHAYRPALTHMTQYTLVGGHLEEVPTQVAG